MAEAPKHENVLSESTSSMKNSPTNNNEQMNRDNIRSLVIRTTITVVEKFEQKNIPFNRDACLARLRKTLEPVLLDPNIPEAVKEKFKQHVKNKIEDFSNTTTHEINVLKNHRIAMSLSTENWLGDIGDMKDSEKQAFFLGKILEATIEKDIEPVAHSLTQSFSPARVNHPTLKDVSYNGSNLKEFTSGIKDLDSTLDLRVLERAIAPLGQKYDISKSKINFQVATALLQGLTDKGYSVKDMVYFKALIGRTSPLAEGVRFSDRREGETTILDKNGKPVRGKDGKNIDGVELLLEYLSKVEKFQGTEREIRETRESATNTGLSDMARGFTGMNQLKTEFDHLKIDNLEKKIREASFPELVMCGTQIAQICPLVGDISGGIDGLISAYNGRTMDGAKLNKLERGLAGIFGVLGITLAGGWAARSYNAGRIEKLIRKFDIIKEVFPGKFAEFLKTGAKLTDEAKAGIMKFAKAMGEEFAQQIDGMMRKQGLILSVMPQENKVLGIQKISQSTPANLNSKFNPQLELSRIKSLPKSERKQALVEFYKNLKVQTDYLVTIPEKVNELSKTIDFSRLSPDEIFKSKAYSALMQDISLHIPQGHIPEIEGRLLKYIQKKCTTHKYFEKMKGNPEQILRDHLGNQGIKLTGDVRAEIDGSTLVFYISDSKDFAKVLHNSIDPIESGGTKGFISPSSKVPALAGSIAVINGKKGDIAIQGALSHELQHIKNQFLFPEKAIPHSEYLDMLMLRSDDGKKYITHASKRGKDEIVAFNKGGGDQFSTPIFLTKQEGEGSNYDYLKYLRKDMPELGSKVNAEYLGKMRKSIEVADDISRKLGDNTANTLAIFPMEKWKRLQKIYTHLDPISESRIHSLPDGGFTGTREFTGGIKHTGTFDKEGNLLNGEKKYYNFIEEGEYYTNGRLKQGNQKWETGTISEGKFDEKGFLEEGSVSIPGAGKYSGKFQNNQLVEGSWERIGGDLIDIGLFHDGRLKTGKRHEKSSGISLEGEFGLIDGKSNLLNGRTHIPGDKYVADYTIMSGKKNGYGSMIYRDGSHILKGEFKDDTFIKGEKITQYDHASGEFYPNGRLKSGQVIDKEYNIVTEGDFDIEGQIFQGKIVHPDWYKEGTFSNGKLHGKECTYSYKEGDIHLKDIGIFENGVFKGGVRDIDGGVSAKGSTFTGTISIQGSFYDGLLEKTDGTILKWSGGRVVDTFKKINMKQVTDKYDIAMLEIMNGKRKPEDLILELENLGKTAPDNKELQKLIKTQIEDILDWKLLNSFS